MSESKGFQYRKIFLRDDEARVIESLLSQLTKGPTTEHLLHILSESFDALDSAPGTPNEQPVSPMREGSGVQAARKVLQRRKSRRKHFGASMFDEPAWEMLLTLFVTENEVGPISIGRLTETVGTPGTTALRWIDYLVQQELVRRKPHPTDARQTLLALTELGRGKLRSYFAETSQM